MKHLRFDFSLLSDAVQKHGPRCDAFNRQVNSPLIEPICFVDEFGFLVLIPIAFPELAGSFRRARVQVGWAGNDILTPAFLEILLHSDEPESPAHEPERGKLVELLRTHILHDTPLDQLPVVFEYGIQEKRRPDLDGWYSWRGARVARYHRFEMYQLGHGIPHGDPLCVRRNTDYHQFPVAPVDEPGEQACGLCKAALARR